MIRLANISDAPAIAEIQVITWQDAYKEIIPEGFLSQLSIAKKTMSWAEQIADQSIKTLVYEVNSDVVGFIAGGNCRDNDLNGYEEIYAIYINPTYQKQGVGCALTKSFLSTHPYSLWVLSENTSAIKFYEKLAFHTDGKTKFLDFGMKKVEEIRLVKI